jgi:hypothetical protein
MSYWHRDEIMGNVIKVWRCGMALMIIVGVLIALIVLDLAAWRWGYDSSEPVDSPEWERRRTWRM